MRRAAIESAMEIPSACAVPAPITVLFYPSPFKLGTKIEHALDGDLTLQAIVDALEIPSAFAWDLRIRIEGMRIPRALWRHTRPNPGVTVTVRAVMHGGQTGKGVLQVVLGLAALAFSVLTFGVGAGGAFGGLAGLLGIPAVAAGTAVGFAAGGLALVAAGSFSLAAPPPAVPFSGEIPSNDSRAISAPQNEVRPFAPVLRVFGRYRVFAPYAAKPYTEVVGNDQFLRLLFTFGYGPLQLSDLKIGEDPVGNFDSVEYNFLPGFDDDPPLSIFTSSIDETALQVDLEFGGIEAIRTTELDTYESSIDLAFPGGLLAFEEKDGAPKSATAHFDISYRAAGTADPYIGVTASAPLGPGISNPSAGTISISSRDRGSLIRGIRWVFPSPGQWEIRIVRNATTVDTNNLGDLVDVCIWTKLRSIRPGTPPQVPNLSLLEMRIRATDQLSGLIQNLSAVVTSILPVWNSLDEWGPDNRLSTNLSLQPTRNAAWALAEMLRGQVNARRVPDENIDSASIAAWAISNTAAVRNFDAVVDFDTTIGQVCRDIAGSSRASFNIIDGRYGVVVDEEKPLITAQFSSRDTSDFTGTKVFNKEIHGLRTRFISPDSGYEPDERIVYADGYDESTAFEFGDLDLWGVTDPDQAYMAARYHMAAGKLRPEIYSFTIDIAQLAITRGDRVLFSHDVMLVGLGTARVTQVFESGGEVVAIKVEGTIEYDPEIEYSIRIRSSSDGSPELHEILNLGVDTEFAVFKTPIAPGSTWPEEGDLAAWGEMGKETGDYIVHAIIPTSDLGARVELVDYSPAIFDVDSEPIPDFDPNITDPRPRPARVPARPVIESVASDETVLILASDGTYQVRILVTASIVQGPDIQASTLQAQYRTSNPVGDWRSAPQVSIQTPQISIENVDQGEAYDIRVRSVSASGRASDWAIRNGHVVIGASTVPPDVVALRVDPGLILVWDYPDPPRDLAGFRVRHQAGTDPLWETAIPAHGGLVSETRFDIGSLPVGERTVLVKAVDAAGNESTNAGVVVKSIGGTPIENIAETEDFHAGGFAGTITNATVEPVTGDLVADAEDNVYWGPPDELYWGSPTDLYWGSSFRGVTYEASWTPIAASVPGRLFLQYTVVGSSWALFYREQGDTEWLAWPGIIDAESWVTYEFRLTINGGNVRGRVSAFAAVIDKPDVEDNIEDFVVASTGTVRLPLSKPFTVIKQVLLTIQDDGNGGIAAIVIDKDATNGPSIRVEDQSGTRVAGLIDAKVRGYN